jgi:pyruvate formate-lyase/glycerol dehydratase family glycyl radical enzyme
MVLTERIKHLRRENIEAKVWIDHERAQIVTNFYQQNEGRYSVPVMRALNFYEICTKKTLYLGKDELIVGERGIAPRYVPTYPEVACHSLEDLQALDRQERIPYHVSQETMRVYEQEIIPYWRGRSMRDKLFSQLDETWKDCYAAGLFTEYMEQRAPGAASLDNTFYQIGLIDAQKQIKRQMENLDFMNNPQATAQREQYKAMLIACDAMILFANRYAELAEQLADEEKDTRRKHELQQIAVICRRVPAQAPRNLWEALQMYWFLHVGVITELNGWDACNPGHIDRHFYPFYQRDLEQGTLTRENAKELLCAFWIKFNNHPAPAKYGVTALESGSYNDFVNISLGGMTHNGTDAVNELSYLFLEILDEMTLVQPQAHIQLSRVNSNEFLRAGCKVIQKGHGFPAIFNADAIIEEQIRAGKTLGDAREGGINGCVETTCYGKEAAILTGYINGPKILELALHDGFDPRIGKQLGPHTGDPRTFTSFEELVEAFRVQVQHVINIKISRNQYIEQMYAKYLPAPFLSVLIKGCIESGKDYNDGGPLYNATFVQCVGIGTMTDSFASIKKHVFDDHTYTMDEVLKALDNDYAEAEIMRNVFANQTPRYGNDEDYADSLMLQISNLFIDAVDGLPNTKGDYYRIDMLPTTCHIYFGRVTGATSDGRHAYTPLSEGISPVQGADRKGPTAAVKSAGKMEHSRTCGTLLNMKFIPSVVQTDQDLEKLVKLVRTYFRYGGHHIQFNIIDTKTLLAAQERPQEYRDLIVRVAGYSDYFCTLGKELQNEIIQRRAHEVI